MVTAPPFSVPSAFHQGFTGKAHWEPLLRARAIEDQCYVLAPRNGGRGATGGGAGEPTDYAAVVDPWGPVLVRVRATKATARSSWTWTPRFAGYALALPALGPPAAGDGLLMRRTVEEGYELDDAPGRVDVDAVFRFFSRPRPTGCGVALAGRSSA